MNSNNIFNFNKTWLDKYTKPIDLRELISNRMTSLIWGNGYYFSTNNENLEKKIDEIEKSIDLNSIFQQAEKIMSVYGEALLVVDRTIGGEIVLNIANPLFNSYVERINNKVFRAVLFVAFEYSNRNYQMRVEYTDKEIIRNITEFNANELNNEANKPVSREIENEIYTKYNLKPREANTLGIIPVIPMANLPFKTPVISSPILATRYPDLTPASNIQEILNEAWSWLSKEGEFNRTRILGEFTPQELNMLIGQLDDVNGTMRDKYRKLMGDFLITAQITDGNTQGKKIEIMQGNPVFEKYCELIKYIVELAYIAAGLSPEKDSSGMQTNTGILFSKSLETETINRKANLRIQQYKALMDIILSLHGVSEENLKEYSFHIKKNLIIDKAQEINNQVVLLQNDLTSRLLAVKAIHGNGGMSDKEAQQLLETIDKENQEYKEKNMEFETKAVEIADKVASSDSKIDKDANIEIKDKEEK